MSKGASEITHNVDVNPKNHRKQRRRRFHLTEKYKFFADATWETSKLFCRETALHGLHYVVDESDLNRNITDSK